MGLVGEAHDFQVDPGEMDFRHYVLLWGDGAQLAEMIATRTASRSYRAEYEYWSVDPKALVLQSHLVVKCLGDKNWTDPVPSPLADAQSFIAPTQASWARVDEDRSMGALYKHLVQPWYVRIAITGQGSRALVTLLRWYRESLTEPSPTFNPSGRYERVEQLGDGPLWCADSMSPP